MISLDRTRILAEVDIDHFHFVVSSLPLSSEACIVWHMDGRMSRQYEALGRFSRYDKRTVLDFIVRYVTNSMLRENLDMRRFERKLEHVSPAFFTRIKRMTAYDKAQAYRNLFSLDSTIEKRSLAARRRAMAKRFHPDAGGDTRVMSLINEAYDYLLEHARS